jgi:hypothetical protein
LSPWNVTADAIVGGGVVAGAGLTLWAWRTKDGPAWRTFCAMVTLALARACLWFALVVSEPARYSAPRPLIVAALLVQFLDAIVTCALALALRRSHQRAEERR